MHFVKMMSDSYLDPPGSVSVKRNGFDKSLTEIHREITFPRNIQTK